MELRGKAGDLLPVRESLGVNGEKTLVKLKTKRLLQVALAEWVGRLEKLRGAATPGGAFREEVWGAAAEREDGRGGGAGQ